MLVCTYSYKQLRMLDIDLTLTFLSVTHLLSELQKVVGVVKVAFPHQDSNQLCAFTLRIYIFLVRVCHGIQEAQAGFIHRHCTMLDDVDR